MAYLQHLDIHTHIDASHHVTNQDSFKLLNKRLDSIQSLLGSLRDQYSTLSTFNTQERAVQPDPDDDHCDFSATTTGIWRVLPGNTWEWTSKSCSASILPEKRTKCQLSIPKMVLLGDSQMFHLAHVMLRGMSVFSCVVMKSGGRCGLLDTYYDIKQLPDQEYQKPNFSKLEGPVSNGLEHPGCTDCGGCDAFLSTCDYSSQTTVTLEYLPMEFVLDVELQSTFARTTQENILHYLAQSRGSLADSVLVVNAGLHDLLVIAAHNHGTNVENGMGEYLETLNLDTETVAIYTEQYRQNVMWLASLLKDHNVSRAIFIATSAIKQPREKSNQIIRSFNMHARSVMESFGYDFIDSFALLDSVDAQQLYSDNVHVHNGGGIYYETIRDLLLRKLCDGKMNQ